MSITEHQFRKTLGLFPTGVTVVTAPQGQDQDVCLTISSLTSVSLDPPQILFCLSKYSKTVPVFKAAPFFAINILTENQAHIADAFATHTLPKGGTLKVCRHEETGCLLFSDALGHVICERGALYEGGDHYIILGRVIAVGENVNDLPLVRQRGQYLTTRPLSREPLQQAV